jgi:hypothetical protein
MRGRTFWEDIVIDIDQRRDGSQGARSPIGVIAPHGFKSAEVVACGPPAAGSGYAGS